MDIRHLVLAVAMVVPVAAAANSLRPVTGGPNAGAPVYTEQEQLQQQYDNLMRVQGGGTTTDDIPYYSQNQAPYYNQNPNNGYNAGYNAGYNPGYGAGTTSDTNMYGQQPAQSTPGLGQPSAPATGFLNWTPGGHGYSH